MGHTLPEILLAFTNFALATLLVWLSLKACGFSIKRAPACFLSSIIGVYWALVYAVVTLAEFGIEFDFIPPFGVGPNTFGGVFIRPGFTVTLAVMVVIILRRYRSYHGTGTD